MKSTSTRLGRQTRPFLKVEWKTFLDALSLCVFRSSDGYEVSWPVVAFQVQRGETVPVPIGIAKIEFRAGGRGEVTDVCGRVYPFEPTADHERLERMIRACGPRVRGSKQHLRSIQQAFSEISEWRRSDGEPLQSDP